MDIIVIGLGEVGKHIAGVLASEGQNVTLIDSSESALSQARESMDVMTLCGDGGRISTLNQANVAGTELVIAVTDNDEVNLLACLMAKKLGAERVIARVSDTDDPLAEDSTWAANLGIDLVISPERAAAVEIARIVETTGVTWVESFGDERVAMVRMRIREESAPAVGRSLLELRLPQNVLVAAIRRNGHLIIPDGSERLADSDELYLIGKTDVLPEARTVLAGPQKPVSKAVIVGASPVGRALAQLLEESKIDTFVVERSAERAEAMAMQIRRGVVVRGDATSSGFIRAENLNNADVLIAATKSDEVNLMAGLIAKKSGIASTIVVSHKPDYMSIYEELGIDTAISPRLLAANQILRYVRRGRVLSVSVLADGAAEFLEMQAEARTRITSTPLKDVGFPKGVRVGAVVTDDDVTVPGGDFVIPAHSRVIVLTTPEQRQAVERLFRKRSFSMS
ncbi:MAG TPA: Trk system potassium transporter TrkA [candidate division Zixibacteria bacterium]|jgi:trk system potassium uptake protein TrkA